MDKEDWVRVIDHTKYLCRSRQLLFFSPRVVKLVAFYSLALKPFSCPNLSNISMCVALFGSGFRRNTLTGCQVHLIATQAIKVLSPPRDGGLSGTGD